MAGGFRRLLSRSRRGLFIDHVAITASNQLDFMAEGFDISQRHVDTLAEIVAGASWNGIHITNFPRLRNSQCSGRMRSVDNFDADCRTTKFSPGNRAAVVRNLDNNEIGMQRFGKVARNPDAGFYTFFWLKVIAGNNRYQAFLFAPPELGLVNRFTVAPGFFLEARDHVWRRKYQCGGPGSSQNEQKSA